jgi:hypothetical protein
MPIPTPTPTPTLAHTEPLAVVIAQLVGYNNRDIDAFAATFADDAVGIDLDTNNPRFTGIAELRERYGKQFREQPNQRSNVVTRSIVGNFVFDLEHITGMSDRPPFHLMAIYRVNQGKIDRVWFSPRV